MGITLDKIQFDPSVPGDEARVGAFLIGSGGTVITDTGGALDVNVSNTVTVTATDLDIRDLIHTSDSVALGDGTVLFESETMDSAFSTTSVGFPVMGIRQDGSGSPVSATGDAHPLVFNDDGELKVAADLTSDVADDAVDSGNPIKIGGQSFDGALSAISTSGDRYHLLGDMYRRTWVNTAPNVASSYEADTVGVAAAELVATPLAGRQRILIQNNGSKAIYLGNDASVTTGNGICVNKDASIELPWGEDLNIFAISGTAGQDVRILEWG